MTTTWNQDLYKRAMDFAATAHKEQKVPGSGHPYVVHLAKVSMEVLAASTAESAKNENWDVDLAMTCAILHDSIEDAGVTAHDIEAKFGVRVAAGVQALTKNASLPKGAQMSDSLLRIRAQPREVWAVKLADRITNLEPAPPAWTREKRAKYRDEAEVILTDLKGGCAFLEQRLAKKISEYVVD